MRKLGALQYPLQPLLRSSEPDQSRIRHHLSNIDIPASGSRDTDIPILDPISNIAPKPAIGSPMHVNTDARGCPDCSAQSALVGIQPEKVVGTGQHQRLPGRDRSPNFRRANSTSILDSVGTN